MSQICWHTVKWLNWSIWPIDGILTSITTPGQSGAGSNGNETGASLSDSLVSYPRCLLTEWWSYLSAKMKLVYSTTPANEAKIRLKKY